MPGLVKIARVTRWARLSGLDSPEAGSTACVLTAWIGLRKSDKNLTAARSLRLAIDTPLHRAYFKRIPRFVLASAVGLTSGAIVIILK
jgi:hypothetical protein